jgi:hypothetical protein
MFVVAALLTGIVSASAVTEGNEEKVKRQASDLSTRLGANNETILVRGGTDVVYLTGNNARVVNIEAGEVVSFENGVVSVTGERVGPFERISRFTYKTCGQPTPVGPGRLFLSDGLAFFINDQCVVDLLFIAQAIANAPGFRVTYEISEIFDAGAAQLELNVNNGEYMMVLTGATVVRSSVTTGRAVTYSGTTLSADGVEISDMIQDLFVISLANNMVVTRSFNASSPPRNFRGPGQLFVGATAAIFIEDISFRTGSSDIAQAINEDLAEMGFIFASVEPNVIMVLNLMNMPITILSAGTKTVNLPRAARVRYSGTGIGGMGGLVSFEASGGRITNINGVTRFSVYDNNMLETFEPPVDISVELNGGGTLFLDTAQNTALFTTDTNPAVAALLQMMLDDIISQTTESVSYSTTTNEDGVRLLLRTVGSTTEPIQTITGSYVVSVEPFQTVTFNDNEVVIEDFFGEPVTRIGEVDLLITNTGPGTSGVFNTSTIVPFFGPGTLTYSRGTAFYTTDQAQGSALSFLSATAPIPRISFEREIIGSNVVDGVSYNVSSVTLTIGGDRVITFEATSYSTSTDQEVLYSGGQVTVTRPIRTGGGSVTYNAITGTVTYRTQNGTIRTLTGVTMFHDYSGGLVEDAPPPDSVVVSGPGKLYVSMDGSQVLFSSTDIITPEASRLIRQGFTDFMASANQFSSIYTGVYNLSTNSSTVTYPGGGVIWYNNLGEALYVDNDGVSRQIARAITSLLVLTKSDPAKDSGIIRTIFNGRSIYSYAPVLGNRDILIGNSVSFVFNGSALIGNNEVRTGINSVVTFNGVEVKEFNSSDAPVTFFGRGLLLVQNDSDTAFFTTYGPSINYLLQSIANVRQFLVPPQIRHGSGSFTTKNRSATVSFGTNVTVYEGAAVTFRCDVVGGRPEPNVSFYRIIPGLPPMELNDSMGITIVNNTLTINRAVMADAGTYECRASNGVPPLARARSSLRVLEPIAPQLQPGWFPFDLRSGQKIIFPTEAATSVTVELSEFTELVFACRMDGRPKATVRWLFNEFPIENLPGVTIMEVGEGRSVLIINLATYNESVSNNMSMRPNLLLGTDNRIQCTGDNAAGASVTGRVLLTGQLYFCTRAVINPCPVSCGFGLREITFTCNLNTQNNVLGRRVDIDEVPLHVVPLIDRTQECTQSDNIGNLIICPLEEFRWNVSEWSECSRTCGGGSRNRTVNCVRVLIPVDAAYEAVLTNITEEAAEDFMCTMFEGAGPKPPERELCQEQDCPFWRTSAFGMCSVSCGSGTSMRTVECIIIVNRTRDMNGKLQVTTMVLPDSACSNDTRPDATRVCNAHPCFYQWLTGKYGACNSIPSAGGAAGEFPFCRERSVFCVNDMRQPVNNSLCQSEIKPTAVASCGGSCFVGIWNKLPWSQCTKSCGYGIRKRELTCYSPGTLTLVPNDFCDASERPAIYERCFAQNCENRCLKDENSVCTILAEIGMCGSPLAMRNDGLYCCVSCAGMVGGD